MCDHCRSGVGYSTDQFGSGQCCSEQVAVIDRLKVPPESWRFAFLYNEFHQSRGIKGALLRSSAKGGRAGRHPGQNRGSSANCEPACPLNRPREWFARQRRNLHSN